jgi:putative transposase
MARMPAISAAWRVRKIASLNVEASRYGWSQMGKQRYGEKTGKRGIKENLVAGRRKKKKDLLAPMIFKGSLNVIDCEGWLKRY